MRSSFPRVDWLPKEEEKGRGVLDVGRRKRRAKDRERRRPGRREALMGFSRSLAPPFLSLGTEQGKGNATDAHDQERACVTEEEERSPNLKQRSGKEDERQKGVVASRSN